MRCAPPSAGVCSQPTRATEDEQRPKPGGGAGTLTVVDNRTGKKYELKISEGGTIRATDLKQITAGGDGVGLRTYDPGCGSPGPTGTGILINL